MRDIQEVTMTGISPFQMSHRMTIVRLSNVLEPNQTQ